MWQWMNTEGFKIKRAVSSIRAETVLLMLLRTEKEQQLSLFIYCLLVIYFEYRKYILTNQLGKLIIVKDIWNKSV